MLRLSVLLLAACFVATHGATPRLAGDCIKPSDRSSLNSLFPSGLASITSPSTVAGVQKEEGRFFQVDYFPTYKLVTNNYTNEKYILYQCGAFEAAPSPQELGQPAGTKVFEIPLQSVSLPDATAAAYMQELGVADRTSHVTTLAVPACYQALATTCGLSASSSSLPNVTTNPNIDAVFGFSSSPNTAKAIAFPATADTSPLARAEWLKYMALFFNKEHEANELFNTIVSTYTRLSEVAITASANAPAPKTVAWIQWWPARPSWGLPNVSTIEIQWPTYKRALVEAAGAELLDNTKLQAYLDDGRLTDYFSWRPVDNGGAFLPASDGDLLREILADVDVVIDTARYNDDDGDFSDGDVSDVDIDLDAFLQRHSLNASDIATLPFLRNNGLLRSDGLTNSGSWTEWFGIMVVRPDQVMADLLDALWPGAASSGNIATTTVGRNVQLSPPLFLRNVAAGQSAVELTPADCVLSNCRIQQFAICPLVFLGCDGNAVSASLENRCAPTCPPINQLDPSTPNPDNTDAPTAAPPAARPLPLLALVVLPLAAVLAAAMAAP